MPTYDDSRYTYNQAFLEYEGLYHYPALTGNQPAPTAELTDLDHLHITLLGNQPATIDVRYEEPGLTYNEPLFNYNFSDSTGFVTWRLSGFRTLLGNQPAASGVSTWRWAPNVWPVYGPIRVTDRRENTTYSSHVDTDDLTVRYRPDISDEHDDPGDEIVYRESPPRPYTHPDDQD